MTATQFADALTDIEEAINASFAVMPPDTGEEVRALIGQAKSCIALAQTKATPKTDNRTDLGINHGDPESAQRRRQGYAAPRQDSQQQTGKSSRS